MVKMKKLIAIILPLMALGLFVMCVEAQWDALNSGYAVTTNYHGVDVQLGTPVTARAGTTEYPNVTSVRFRWIPPVGDEILTDAVNLTPSDPSEYWNGELIYDAFNTTTIDVLGEWGVQALFYDSAEPPNLMHETGIKKIRATSFFAVPQVPFGTIAIVLTMLGGLSVFALKKKESACT